MVARPLAVSVAVLHCLLLMGVGAPLASAFNFEQGIAQAGDAAGCISSAAEAGCERGVALRDPTAVLAVEGAGDVEVVAASAAGVTSFGEERWRLKQATGEHACLGDPADGCAPAPTLVGATGLAQVPQSNRILVVSPVTDALTVLEVDRVTDHLRVRSCISATGSGGRCQVGRALEGATAVAAEGDRIYVASPEGDSLAIIRSDAYGSLYQSPGPESCISEDGTGGTCLDGRALDGATDVVLSRGHRATVYVASEAADAIAVLHEGSWPAAVEQRAGTAACISRDGAGGCAPASGLDGVRSLALGPDDRRLYSAAGGGSGAVAAFERDRETGALEPRGCLAAADDARGCAASPRVAGAADIAVSREGGRVFVLARASDAVALLIRDPATGRLEPHPGATGCVAASGASCGRGRGLGGLRALAAMPQKDKVYAVSRTAVLTLEEFFEPQCGAFGSTFPATMGRMEMRVYCRSGNGGALSVEITQPAHGQATLDADRMVVTYTPRPGFVGTDSLLITATEPSGATARAPLTFNVTGPAVAAGAEPLGEPVGQRSTTASAPVPRRRVPSPAPRVVIRRQAVAIDGRGRALVRIACVSRSRACRGTVVSRGARAASAFRRFSLRAGTTRGVRVSIPKHRREARTLEVATMVDGRTRVWKLRVKRR